jgi:virginiamycin B lyase
MPPSRLLAGVAAVVAAVTLVAGAGAATSPNLGKTLRAGGLVLVLRHAHTDQSKQDDDPVVVSDCTTQRNLSGQGRADARAIGRGVRRLGLPIGKVLSSAYCRTLETARLAFGRATVSPALLNTIAAAHDARWRAQVAAARRLIGTKPAKGTLTVLVTHGILVTEATGQSLEEGEAIVFRPLGKSRFRVVGRVMPAEWGTLRTTSAARKPRVREYRVPAGSHPHDVAPAPDGTVWYTAQLAGALGRLDPKTGKTTHVPLGDGSAPHGVIVGPDGAPWITDGGLNAIVRVDPQTLEVKQFPLPASSAFANLNTATFDRAGVLWFTGQSGIYGRLEPESGALRVFRARRGRTGSRPPRRARSGTRPWPGATSRGSTARQAGRRSSGLRRRVRARGASGRTRAGGSGSASGTPASSRATTRRRGAGASGTCPGGRSRTPCTSTTETSCG